MFETKCLILREWKDSDIPAFAAMNQDPEVMEFFPSTSDLEGTKALVQRIRQHFKTHGFGAFAVELKATGEFIGFVGLMTPSFEAHFTPCVEIGWRIAKNFWNQGYATEAAKMVLRLAFEKYGLKEVVSFTAAVNKRSMRIMEKIGLQHDPQDDFDHPKLDKAHPLARHVLYRLKAVQPHLHFKPLAEKDFPLMENKHLVEICKVFELGASTAKPTRVHGGLLHRMWKIKTAKGLYAVKQLSSDINLKDEAINSNYELTEEIATRFAKRGIPAISALKSQDKHLLEIEGTYFLVYPWVNAIAIASKVISEAHALKIAEILAQIHQINLAVPRPEDCPSEPYTTECLLNTIRKAEEFQCPFAADLRVHEQDLIAIKDAYVRSVEPLKQHVVMTHGDLDQKNVLWDEHNQPILIDWEAATFVNPTYDLINTALNWCGIITEQFDQALFVRMIEAYETAGGVIHYALLSAAFDGACGWIHWMVYNIERACVLGESEQKTIGIEQVNQTLATLLRLRKATPDLLSAFTLNQMG